MKALCPKSNEVSGSGDCQPYEVFVAARPFTDFGGALLKRMSPDAKAMLVELGVCAYLLFYWLACVGQTCVTASPLCQAASRVADVCMVCMLHTALDLKLCMLMCTLLSSMAAVDS